MTATVEEEVPALPRWGRHLGVKYEDYSRWEAVNHSILRLFNRTPAHARQAIVKPPKQTPEQEMGHATHLAILEPDRFDIECRKVPKVDRRYKEGKLRWAEFERESAGATLLMEPEYDLCLALRDAVWKHPTAREILSGAGYNEVSVLWLDQETSVPLKARLDRASSLGGWSVIADLKTCEDAGRLAFSRSIFKYGYHQQAALYLDGCDAIDRRPRKYMFIAVEKAPPYCVAVYELEDIAIEQGRDTYRKNLRTYVECMETGIFPGYGDGADIISLPAYAFKFHGEDLT